VSEAGTVIAAWLACVLHSCCWHCPVAVCKCTPGLIISGACQCDIHFCSIILWKLKLTHPFGAVWIISLGLASVEDGFSHACLTV
jgi:hypothetical protein